MTELPCVNVTYVVNTDITPCNLISSGCSDPRVFSLPCVRGGFCAAKWENLPVSWGNFSVVLLVEGRGGGATSVSVSLLCHAAFTFFRNCKTTQEFSAPSGGEIEQPISFSRIVTIHIFYRC